VRRYRRNSDERLRLERAATAGDPEAQEALLVERLRAGKLHYGKAVLAAMLGDHAARRALQGTGLDVTFDNWDIVAHVLDLPWPAQEEVAWHTALSTMSYFLLVTSPILRRRHATNPEFTNFALRTGAAAAQAFLDSVPEDAYSREQGMKFLRELREFDSDWVLSHQDRETLEARYGAAQTRESPLWWLMAIAMWGKRATQVGGEGGELDISLSRSWGELSEQLAVNAGGHVGVSGWEGHLERATVVATDQIVTQIRIEVVPWLLQ
jgi:hypothetical protein